MPQIHSVVFHNLTNGMQLGGHSTSKFCSQMVAAVNAIPQNPSARWVFKNNPLIYQVEGIQVDGRMGDSFSSVSGLRAI